LVGKHLWNDGWLFLKTPVGMTFEEAAKRKEEFMPVVLPHDWLIQDSYKLYEDSMGWYSKKFEFKEKKDKKAFVIFEGVYMDSTVFVNGMKVGEWKYGFSTFTLDMTDYLEQGINEIMVSACFQSPSSRWYTGAGVYRDVWFKVTDETYLPENAIYVNAKKQGEGEFLLAIESKIEGKRAEEASLRFGLFGEKGMEVGIKPLSSSNHGGKYLVRGVQSWDIENPMLYVLKAEVILDDETIWVEKIKIGFRDIRYDAEKGFFLNGRHLKLNGVCEHHDLGALGTAFNKSAMRRKFRILKEMGVNAVRGAHNMMASGFMDLADEMGILVLSEGFDVWEKAKTKYDYARFFKEWSAKDVESWVKRDRNHPSVILWSIGNEIYDIHASERGQELTLCLKNLVEKYDAGRNAAVTFSSNYMPWENAQKCADIVKVVGYNYSEKYYEDHHRQHPDWVIYGSETSSIVQSRGVYHFPLQAGILSEDDEQCSSLGNSTTSWGAKSIEECVAMDRDMDFSMGQFLWTGFDYIGEPTPYHTKNSYFGQIDTAGFKKDSYYIWQSVWTDYRKYPMVHVFPYWDFNEGQMIDVRICSNGCAVELIVNGRSFGKQYLDHGKRSGRHIIADYQVPYEKGVLTAIAYDEEGREIAREEKKSFGNSREITVSPENTQVKADGKELLFLEINTKDENGNIVENACDRVRVEVTGKGRLVGLDNGDSTDYDSYKGVSRRLFNGKLLAMVQTERVAGEIRVSVTGKGLKRAVYICKTVPMSEECESTAGNIYMEPDRSITDTLEEIWEIPVRKINLISMGGRTFTQAQDTIAVKAEIEPPEADDQQLFFKVTDDKGVAVNFVGLKQEGNMVMLKARSDGCFRLVAMSKSGTDKIRVLSQLEFSAEGIGRTYLNPYGFISGSSYTSFSGDVSNGNEKGIATSREGETVITYSDIDFGDIGSDEITIPIFALNSEEYPLQIWEGVPGEKESMLLADVVYQKPSLWNEYQPETYKLSKRLKGIAAISLLLNKKVHIKGFSFTKYEKAWLTLFAGEADAVYGDNFYKGEKVVERIGNNVSLVFSEMDFGKMGTDEIVIRGRAGADGNTIHVRFSNREDEMKQAVEFPSGEKYSSQRFKIKLVKGKWDVTFIFLPGSSFDFESIQFIPVRS
jgi:Beta-galactosidase/beta-glucuronidase